MNPPITYPPARHRRRRRVSVEVYFVLYLSAITLLLGTTSRGSDRADQLNLEEAVTRLVGSDFKLSAERAALLYSVVPAGAVLDPAQSANLRRDTVNVIHATGNVTNIHFKIAAINDSLTGRQLPMNYASLIRQNDRTVLFRWSPSALPANHSAVYRVTICGTADPVLPSSLDRPEIRQRVLKVLESRGAMTDSVTFTVNLLQSRAPQLVQLGTKPPGDTAAAPASTPTGNLQAFPANSGLIPFQMQVTTPLIRTVPRATWTNRIIITGVPDAQKINYRVSPNARITGATATSLELTGVAPATGRQQVTISGQRADGQTATVTFDINATPLDSPDLPASLYAEQSYRLNFGSSDIASGQISVEVSENGKVVTRHEDNGSLFEYTPSASGTVRFQRYIGSQPIDVLVKSIRPLPAPTVESVKPEGSDEAIVRTVSYGTVNGAPNRAQLKVQMGNADDAEELTDRYRYDPVELAHTQYWRVHKKHSGEFNFTVYAIDKRGSRFKSATQTFNP